MRPRPEPDTPRSCASERTYVPSRAPHADPRQRPFHAQQRQLVHLDLDGLKLNDLVLTSPFVGRNTVDLLRRNRRRHLLELASKLVSAAAPGCRHPTRHRPPPSSPPRRGHTCPLRTRTAASLRKRGHDSGRTATAASPGPTPSATHRYPADRAFPRWPTRLMPLSRRSRCTASCDEIPAGLSRMIIPSIAVIVTADFSETRHPRPRASTPIPFKPATIHRTEPREKQAVQASRASQASLATRSTSRAKGERPFTNGPQRIGQAPANSSPVAERET